MSYTLTEGLLKSLGEGVEQVLKDHALKGSISFDVDYSEGSAVLNGFTCEVDTDFLVHNPHREIEEQAIADLEKKRGLSA